MKAAICTLSAHMLGLGARQTRTILQTPEMTKADARLTRSELADLFSDYLYGRSLA
ncbi:MAG: hypothetical protein V4712_03815 [Pseudomonadota bacterium]